jgi:hypothetical protein
MAEALFEAYTVYCFFHCGYVVRELTPFAAHDVMEAHYAAEHAAAIARILRQVR